MHIWIDLNEFVIKFHNVDNNLKVVDLIVCRLVHVSVEYVTPGDNNRNTIKIYFAARVLISDTEVDCSGNITYCTRDCMISIFVVVV